MNRPRHVSMPYTRLLKRRYCDLTMPSSGIGEVPSSRSSRLLQQPFLRARPLRSQRPSAAGRFGGARSTSSTASSRRPRPMLARILADCLRVEARSAGGRAGDRAGRSCRGSDPRRRRRAGSTTSDVDAGRPAVSKSQPGCSGALLLASQREVTSGISIPACGVRATHRARPEVHGRAPAAPRRSGSAGASSVSARGAHPLRPAHEVVGEWVVAGGVQAARSAAGTPARIFRLGARPG